MVEAFLCIFKEASGVIRLIFRINDREYYITYDKDGHDSMEISLETKGEFFSTFYHMLWFNRVDTIYTFDDPEDTRFFFYDLAVDGGKNPWAFSHGNSMFCFKQIDIDEFKKFRDDKVLTPDEFIDPTDDDSSFGYIQTTLMHYMILTEEMEHYIINVQNT